MRKQVMITVGDREYPCYRTMRGMVDIQRSEKTQELGQGSIEALLHSIYLTTRGACVREKVPFDMDFETFVNEVDPDVIDVFALLGQEEGEQQAGNDNTAKKKK